MQNIWNILLTRTSLFRRSNLQRENDTGSGCMRIGDGVKFILPRPQQTHFNGYHPCSE